jgi:hypothetical protein
MFTLFPLSRAYLLLAIFLLPVGFVLATANYAYGPDEYVTIANGISPDGKYAITAHGNGEFGYDDFHLYLTDAGKGDKIGPLEEVVDSLDTDATSFAGKWSKKSDEVMIVYRVDRHAPLKAISYRIKNRRAERLKGPFDVMSDELIKYWQTHCSQPKPSPKIFGSHKGQ